MTLKMFSLSLSLFLIFFFSACSLSQEPEALSGVAPVTTEVQPEALDPSSSFSYDQEVPLADSYNQMNSLRATIGNEMYSTVVSFSGDSAWVPIEADKYTIGCDEFIAASYIMEIEPSITTKKIMKEQGFDNIEISDLDVENSWKIIAQKNENGVIDNYEYTVRYGKESDSYRFTRTINNSPDMMLASRRINGGYAVQVWTPSGEYRIIANDSKEGRLGFIPKSRSDTELRFPEKDIFYDASLLTNTFTTANAQHTFLLANNILYISKDGANYAVPLM